MKKNLFVLLVLPSLIYSQIDTTDINKLNLENQKTGVWKEVILPDEEQNISDTLVAYYTYQNDIKNGFYEIYSSDKTLYVKGNYENGEQKGEIINYYPNGNIKYRFNKINDSFDGPFFNYSENGKVKTYKLYDSGKTTEIKHYYENGDIWIRIEMEKKNLGKERWKVYYENGNLKAEGSKLNDTNIGIWKEYSENGELIKTIKN